MATQTPMKKILSKVDMGLPVLRKPPIFEKIKSLHSKNIAVAQICKEEHKNSIQAYISQKNRYLSLIKPKKDNQISNAISQLKEKSKVFQKKNQMNAKRVFENIQRLNNRVEDMREQIKKKEHEKMEKSQIRRSEFYRSMSSSQRKSEDRRSILKVREQKELEESMTLLSRSMTKLENAKKRRVRKISQLSSDLSEKHNQSLLYAKSNHQNIAKNTHLALLQRSIRKFQAIASKIQEKQNKEKKDYEAKSKAQHKRIAQAQQQNNKILTKYTEVKEQEFAKKYAKIERALLKKDTILHEKSMNLNTKRSRHEQTIKTNTVHLKTQNEQVIYKIQQKNENNLMFLTSIKLEKDQLIKDNLYKSQQFKLRY